MQGDALRVDGLPVGRYRLFARLLPGRRQGIQQRRQGMNTLLNGAVLRLFLLPAAGFGFALGEPGCLFAFGGRG